MPSFPGRPLPRRRKVRPELVIGGIVMSTAPVPAPSPSAVLAVDVASSDAVDDDLPADIDDGEVYAPLTLGPDAVPARRPRLRLRHLDDAAYGEACVVVERLGAALSAKITDAEDWVTAEGYITALPHLLYDKLQPFAQSQQGPARTSTTRAC